MYLVMKACALSPIIASVEKAIEISKILNCDVELTYCGKAIIIVDKHSDPEKKAEMLERNYEKYAQGTRKRW